MVLSYNMRRDVPLSVKGDVHYNERYFSQNSGWSVAQFSAGVPFDLGKLSITPEALFQKALDEKNFKDNTEFSVSVRYDF